MPKVSICVPAHKGMKNHDFFLERLTKSVESQTFKDYELIVTYEGAMAENTNAAMRKAKGEIIKILYLDDYFQSEHALANIVRWFDATILSHYWLASGCTHDNGNEKYLSPHLPSWGSNLLRGENTIGSPSVIALRNGLNVFFDEKLSWLLDCDFYLRLEKKYGKPIFLNEFDVAIGIGDHQTSHTMSDLEKKFEHNYLDKKYI